MEMFWQFYNPMQMVCGIFSLVMAITGWIMLILYFHRVKLLQAEPLHAREDWPTVSLIAPARNEARNIEEAVRSLLNIDYPHLQITVVNDRSTDATGEILRRVAAEDNRLQVLEIDSLPAGWLGKNYALHAGAEQSQGEWLLFTDADVVFAPDALQKAMQYALRNHCVHLCAFPDMRLTDWFLQSMVITFAQMLIYYIRPWQVGNPRRKAYMGVGAFNLVMREAYRQTGGHQAIPMRPDDDLKLGQLLKQHGFHSDVINAYGSIQVEWYRSLTEMIRGLEKNSAAPLEYNSGAILMACLVLVLAYPWPFIAVWLTSGWAWGLFMCTIGLLISANVFMAAGMRQRWWLGLFFPITISIFIYIQLRSLCLLWYYRGIHWRGTHYSLTELKANRLPSSKRL
jgi:cellulose synthase/poly-beta-1,6-N-acetylglucosamine synthase-like glycosyltransferase